MKLALGTAQFGQKYGVANVSGRPTKRLVQDILAICRDYGIDTLDTAISYGESESLLGEIGVNEFKVVSKLPAFPAIHDLPYSEVEKWVRDQINQSLKRLRCESLSGLLVHHPEDLLSSRGKKAWEVLEYEKTKHRIDALGVSVYSPIELKKIEEKFNFQIVQCPLNIFDRRFDKSGLIQKLKANGVTVFVRSVFLQGLLLMFKEHRPSYFKKWVNELGRWDAWLQEFDEVPNLPLRAALAYVYSISGIHRVLVGVDSPEQLLNIINTHEAESKFPDWDFSNVNGLIDPREWK